MSLMKNILSKTGVGALAIGVALAISPIKADAATVINPPAQNLLGGVVQYDAGPLVDDAFVFGFDINIQDAVQTQIEGDLGGFGTLTIGTFVDPFISGASGAAQILLDIGEVLPGGAFVKAQWGGGPIVDLSDGVTKGISTTFADIAEVKDLVFTWENLTASEQLSVKISPVPLPAGGLLLLTAIGGVAALRRKRKSA